MQNAAQLQEISIGVFTWERIADTSVSGICNRCKQTASGGADQIKQFIDAHVCNPRNNNQYLLDAFAQMRKNQEALNSLAVNAARIISNAVGEAKCFADSVGDCLPVPKVPTLYLNCDSANAFEQYRLLISKLFITAPGSNSEIFRVQLEDQWWYVMPFKRSVVAPAPHVGFR